MNNFF